MANKLFKVATIALFIAGTVSGCSSNVSVMPSSVAMSGTSNFSGSNLVTRISQNVTQSKQDASHFYIDAGKGKITGASLTVKLNLGNGGFKTKSANGIGARIASDIASFDIALIDSASSPATMPGTLAASGTVTKTGAGGTASNDGDLGGLGNIGTGKTYTTITFTNVPESANKYWVAVAAKDGDELNITNVSGTLTNSTGNLVAGKYYVSSTGGGSNLGSMAVTKSVVSGRALYKVESISDLAIALTLADATSGADISSAVTVNDGTTAITGDIGIN